VIITLDLRPSPAPEQARARPGIAEGSNAARDELAAQGTHVMSVHCALVDTDMTPGMALPKLPPEELVTTALDALETGEIEVLADQFTRETKAMLSDYPYKRPPF
jgi:hypothetical protein